MTQQSTTITVFLVDDSDIIRERVAAMLAKRSIKVVGQAESPQEAIDGVLSADPDVVVLDVQLHGGSGLQVLRAVRQRQPRTAFVVFSNNSTLPYRNRYLSEGAQRFLDKSTEFNQLVDAVEHASRSAPARSKRAIASSGAAATRRRDSGEGEFPLSPCK